MAIDGVMWILTWIHGMTNSWGIAIIGLTILVRLAMHPLTKKQMDSMKKMQELQPRMKVLQEKYADDKEMQSKKVMELYKEHKVNPASGCLPLLVQLPIFILLYNVLTTHGFPDATFLSVRLDGSILTTIAKAINLVYPSGHPDAFQPITDEDLGFIMVIFSAMSNPSLLFANIGMWLPNTVLLIVISFLTWYQQHISSKGNPQMAMMSWFMPLFMTFICVSLPGGVLLYWGVSSLIGVVSQIFVMRKASVEMQKKPVLLQEKPTHKEAE
jgi:YidC/Oxa1 family membrane protein insertase